MKIDLNLKEEVENITEYTDALICKYDSNKNLIDSEMIKVKRPFIQWIECDDNGNLISLKDSRHHHIVYSLEYDKNNLLTHIIYEFKPIGCFAPIEELEKYTIQIEYFLKYNAFKKISSIKTVFNDPPVHFDYQSI